MRERRSDEDKSRVASRRFMGTPVATVPPSTQIRGTSLVDLMRSQRDVGAK